MPSIVAVRRLDGSTLFETGIFAMYRFDYTIVSIVVVDRCTDARHGPVGGPVVSRSCQSCRPSTPTIVIVVDVDVDVSTNNKYLTTARFGTQNN